MARQANPAKTREVKPKLTPHQYECLQALVRDGYGSNPTEVAKYLIGREIDDLKRTGVLSADKIQN